MRGNLQNAVNQEVAYHKGHRSGRARTALCYVMYCCVINLCTRRVVLFYAHYSLPALFLLKIVPRITSHRPPRKVDDGSPRITAHHPLPDVFLLRKMRGVTRITSNFYRSVETRSMFKDVPLRTRRGLLLYKVYSNSALLVLNGTSLNGDSTLLVLNGTSLNGDSTLLALNWRYAA